MSRPSHYMYATLATYQSANEVVVGVAGGTSPVTATTTTRTTAPPAPETPPLALLRSRSAGTSFAVTDTDVPCSSEALMSAT